jgi:hypothetical protein
MNVRLYLDDFNTPYFTLFINIYRYFPAVRC